MNKITQKFAVLASSAAFSLVIIETDLAQAATISNDFTVIMTSGSEAGNQYFGSLSYDDSLLAPSTEPSPGIFVNQIGKAQSLKILFNYKGSLYNETSEPVDFPTVQLENDSLQGKEFAGLFWLVFLPPEIALQFSGNFFGVKNPILDPNSAQPGVFESQGFVTFSPERRVPESSTIGALGLVGICGILTKKKLIQQISSKPSTR